MEKKATASPNPHLAARTAKYVRRATEHQEYFPENQLEVILEYAAAHGMEIVQAYSDDGRSGINIAGHGGHRLRDSEGRFLEPNALGGLVRVALAQ
jgi:Resolvase, N terminal domain